MSLSQAIAPGGAALELQEDRHGLRRRRAGRRRCACRMLARRFPAGFASGKVTRIFIDGFLEATVSKLPASGAYCPWRACGAAARRLGTRTRSATPLSHVHEVVGKADVLGVIAALAVGEAEPPKRPLACCGGTRARPRARSGWGSHKALLEIAEPQARRSSWRRELRVCLVHGASVAPRTSLVRSNPARSPAGAWARDTWQSGFKE